MENDRYHPEKIESYWYAQWEETGCFYVDNSKEAKPYVIAIPPPNVTGHLHIGHALNNTIQDILIRWKGCQDLMHYGFRVLTMLELLLKMLLKRN